MTSEKELIEEVQRGNVDAYRHVVDLHVSSIRRFLSVSATRYDMVDDLAHETFVFAFRNIQRFEAGTSFRAWLRAIAWNLLRAELKRRSLETKNKERFAEHLTTLGEMANPTESVSSFHENLESCLARVPDKMRSLLTMKYRDAQSSDAISTKLKRSAEWVRTNLYRLRLQLRACIERQNGGQPQ